MKTYISILLLVIALNCLSETRKDTIGYYFIFELDTVKGHILEEKLAVVYSDYNFGMRPDSLFKQEYIRRYNENYLYDKNLELYKTYLYYKPILDGEYPVRTIIKR